MVETYSPGGDSSTASDCSRAVRQLATVRQLAIVPIGLFQSTHRALIAVLKAVGTGLDKICTAQSSQLFLCQWLYERLALW